MGIFDGVSKEPYILRNRAIRAAIVANPNSQIPKRVTNFNLWFNSGIKRYVRSDATGGGNGTTNTISGGNGAWTMAEANAAVIAAYTWVVYTGDFSGQGITANDATVLHDLRLATLTDAPAAATSTWVATGTNGEYKNTANVAINNRYCAVFEDKLRLNGLHLAYGAQSLVATATPGGDVIRVTGWAFLPKVNDQIGMVTADLIGLTRGVRYYILTVNAAAPSPNTFDITISLTQGGAPITPTAFGGTPRFWSLCSDMVTKDHGVPIPGQLGAGEYCFVPWDGSVGGAPGTPAVYMKPSAGLPATHTYHVGTAAAVSSITCAAIDCIFLGGWVFGTSGNCVTVPSTANGSKFYGGVYTACQDGIIASLAGNVKVWGCEIYDCCAHALISTDITNLESASRLAYNVLGACQELPLDFNADAQHLISSPGSLYGYWHDNVSYRCGRLLAETAQVEGQNVPFGYTYNVAIVGLDSTSHTRIENNYFEMVPGSICLSMPSSNPGGINLGTVNNIFRNNIVDMRASLAYPGAGRKNTLTRISANLTSPFPNTGNIFEGNLWLVGNTTRSGTGVSSGLDCSNNQTAGTSRVIGVTFCNNVIYGGEATISSSSAWLITKYLTNGFSVEPVITQYGNIWCGPNQPNGALRYIDSSINTTYTVAQMASGYGTGPSLVKTESELLTYLNSGAWPYSSTARGTGVVRTLVRDSRGNLRVPPFTAGPSEYIAPKAIKV